MSGYILIIEICILLLVINYILVKMIVCYDNFLIVIYIVWFLSYLYLESRRLYEMLNVYDVNLCCILVEFGV